VISQRWLCLHGRNVARILWITPAGTVENLLKQLRSWVISSATQGEQSWANTVDCGGLKWIKTLLTVVNSGGLKHCFTVIKS
jgi:hypothetical protein